MKLQRSSLGRAMKSLAQTTVILLSTVWLAIALSLNPSVGAAQDSKRGTSTTVKAKIVPALREISIDRELFVGNEAQIGAINYVNTDCSSGPIADLRIVTAPKFGDYRLEQISIPIDRPKDSSRASCNGKPVNAVGVFYKPNTETPGQDVMIIDADFRNGIVRRYRFKITVR